MRTDLEAVENQTWLFRENEKFHLDSAQKAKKKVAAENDGVEYDDLRARVIEYYGTVYVAVVQVRGGEWSMPDECPSCGTNPWGTSYVVTLET